VGTGAGGSGSIGWLGRSAEGMGLGGPSPTSGGSPTAAA
jgi:hypothetical protein